jgi:hypothetical protein
LAEAGRETKKSQQGIEKKRRKKMGRKTGFHCCCYSVGHQTARSMKNPASFAAGDTACWHWTFRGPDSKKEFQIPAASTPKTGKRKPVTAAAGPSSGLAP